MAEKPTREEMLHGVVTMLYESTKRLNEFERSVAANKIDPVVSVSEQIRSNCETLANAINAMYL